MGRKAVEFGTSKAWFVCLVGALYFFYAFIQMALLNSLGEPMMRELGFSASGVAKLSASYFYANILFLFPAGVILDHVSTRKVMLLGISVMIICSLGLGYVNDLSMAMLLRFVFGIAGSFCLLSNVRLASRWFPPQKLALVIGVIIMLAMTGGLIAQTPFTLLADQVGWRNSFLIDGVIGVVILLALALVVKDRPADSVIPETSDHGLPLRATIGRVLLNSQNWLAGLYISLMNIPVMIMIVFGSFFLEQASGMGRTEASFVMTVFLIGAIIGSPAFGWLSDWMGNRKKPMIIAAAAAILLSLPLLHPAHLSVQMVYTLFFALGFVTSAQVIGFPLVAESNLPELTGAAEGVASVLVMAGGLAPQLFAYLLRVDWVPKFLHRVPQYGLENYHRAMVLVPVVFILAVVMAFFLKDAHWSGNASE